MNRLSLVTVAGALAVLLVPLAPSAHEGHCVDIFILSGSTAAGDENRQGTNPGALMCQVDQEAWNTSPAHMDSNFTVPGATHLWVALFNSFLEPQRGSITIGDEQAQPLTFGMNEARGRWESQSVSLEGVPPNSSIVATVDVDGMDQTVTYTRI